jgi:hypothetical protein
MSEKTPTERVETQAESSERLSGNRERNPWIALLDARARRAEAAEELAEAYTAWRYSCDLDVWCGLAPKIKKYEAAREAVRKLEEGT